MTSTENLTPPRHPGVAHLRDRSHDPAQPYSTHSKRRRATPRGVAYEERWNQMEPLRTSNEKDIEGSFERHFKTHAIQYGQDFGCVFLLWDSKTPITRATEVRVRGVGTNNISEDEIFRDLRRTFQKYGNSWAKYLKLRKISSIKPVKFRFIKRVDSEYLVNLLTEDFSDHRNKYQARIDALAEQFDDYQDPEDFCYPDPDNNQQYRHIHSACGFFDPYLSLTPTCPFEEYDTMKSAVNWFDTLAFLTCYFLHPDAAKGQVILSSPMIERFTYPYHTIKFRSQRDRRYTVFSGLYLEEQWQYPRTISLVVVVLLATISVLRAIWRSWEVVFGATSCVIAAMSHAYTLYND